MSAYSSPPPPLVFLFSGQGSQYYGMGRHVRAEHPAFGRHLEQLDRVAREELGASLLEIVYDPTKYRDAVFDRLLHSSPAIVMIELALAGLLADAGIEPQVVLGTSLGEFAASVVAGALSAEQALRAVIRQSRLAEACCPAGGMLSILHGEAIMEEPWLAERCELVAVNTDAHFVVAGTLAGLREVSAELQAREILFQLLPCSFPFHSSLLDRGDPRYRLHLQELEVPDPKLPFVSCVAAKFLDRFPRGYWWQLARGPIRFREAIATIEATFPTAIYLDLGPSGSLAAALARILPNRERARALLSPFQANARCVTQTIARLGSSTRHSPIDVRDLL